jgi:hypothetical protein
LWKIQSTPEWIGLCGGQFILSNSYNFDFLFRQDNDKTIKKYLELTELSRDNSTFLRRTCVAKPTNVTLKPHRLARAVAQDLVRNWRPVLTTCAISFGKGYRLVSSQF